MRPVLVTRAEPGASRTCETLQALGYAPVNAATAVIGFFSAALDLAPGEAIALTSPNGAQAAARLTPRRDAPVYTVGAATADAARALGFKDITSADGDGAALAELICALGCKDVVHVRGKDQAFDLVGALGDAGVRARGLVAYGAEPVSDLSAAARTALSQGAAVLIHSAKGAERLQALAEQAGLADRLAAARLIAISQSAAAPLRSAGARSVSIAETPDETALLAALSNALR